MSNDATSMPSRRAILSALGATAGAGALIGALSLLDLSADPGAAASTGSFTPPAQADFRAQSRDNETSVVVIGAGVAGLATAYELIKGGYDVTVVEATDRAGGRNLTARAGTVLENTRSERQRCRFLPDLWFNCGPARIAQHHTTLDYCRELGVPVEVFVNANIDAFVARDGTVRRRRTVAADLSGYVTEVLNKSTSSEVLDAPLTADERAALIDFVNIDRGYVDPPGSEAGTRHTEPEPLDRILGTGVGSRLRFENGWHQAMPMFHPVGGMDAIVDALIDAIGIDRVQFGQPVDEIGRTSAGVRVVGAGWSIDADWGVCCIQPGLAAELPNPWSDAVNRSLRTPTDTVTGKVGLEYVARFWEEDDRILGGTTLTPPQTRVIWYPSTGYLGDGGVIVGGYPFGPSGTAFDRMSHDDRVDLALSHGEAVHGSRYRSDLRSSFSVGWGSVPYIQAAWTNWTSYGADYRRLQEPADRWFFAGDWLSHTPGWQHGAFESARVAASGLHSRALSE